jgi:hypothetical protein
MCVSQFVDKIFHERMPNCMVNEKSHHKVVIPQTDLSFTDLSRCHTDKFISNETFLSISLKKTDSKLGCAETYLKPSPYKVKKTILHDDSVSQLFDFFTLS